MLQLPDASSEQKKELYGAPVHGPRICLLAEVPEFHLSFSLELLLALDVTNLGVQVSDTFGEVVDVLFVARAVIRLGITYDDVQVHPDLTMIASVRVSVVRREADLVVA